MLILKIFLLIILKKLVPNFSDKGVWGLLWKLATLFKVRIDAKKNTLCIKIHSVIIAKPLSRI